MEIKHESLKTIPAEDRNNEMPWIGEMQRACVDASVDANAVVANGQRAKVSVIIPIYNVEDYLQECLESIAGQSLDSMEVLLVDDGSTDESPKIASDFAETDSRFVYLRKPNGGLGDARNYGIDRATGEYLCFCDSDDVIPRYAYEHLYELAKKHDCDIVSGDLERFNSSKSYPSSLHQIAFARTCEVMNAHDYPELLFDSVTVTKMFRREFFLATGLRFPTGIYYEDIPVNTPIACLTNAYAHLDEIVYRWRVRDGEDKSITQRRTEWKNCEDRLKVMRMTDEYFDEHIPDEVLKREKDYKFMRLDMRLYINVLKNTDEEYQRAFMKEAVPYARGIDPSIFKRLDSVDRIKYHYLLNDDLDGLLSFCRWATAGTLKALPIEERGGRYFAQYPFKDLPEELCDITEELKRSGCITKVRKASFGPDGARIDGEAYLRKLSASKDDDIDIHAYLISAYDNSLVTELPAEIHCNNGRAPEVLHSFRNRYVRVLKREKTNYTIRIGRDILDNLEQGSYRIRFEYRYKQLNCEAKYVSVPADSAAAHPKPEFDYKHGEKRLIRYDAERRLALEVLPQERLLVHSVSMADGLLRVDGANGYHGQVSIEPPKYAIVGDESCFLLKDDGHELDYDGPSPQILVYHGGALRITADEFGRLAGECLPEGAIGETVMKESSFVYAFGICEGYPGQLQGKWHASLIGKKHGLTFPLGALPQMQNGRCVVRFDASETSLTENMRTDEYTLHLVCDEGDKKGRVIPVLMANVYSSDVARIQVHGYIYAAVTKDKMGLKTRKKWSQLESTKRRRRMVRDKVYLPIYKVVRRVVPVKKDMVLFESYWGSQTGCNPAGVYRYIDEEHPEIECVWSLEDARMPIPGNGKRVLKGSLKYYLTIARAGALVNNVNFENWYQKRKGQVEIQTTHGTPLKTVGFAAPSESSNPEALTAFAKRCERWDYLIAEGPKAESILIDNYRFKKQMLKTGFPRNDIMIRKNTPEEQKRIRAEHGLPVEGMLVLYAPTWRKKNRFDFALDFTELLDNIGEGVHLGFRPHHYSAAGVDWDELDPRVLDMMHEMTTEESLLAADVLITDYSSLMFDYAVLQKPMLFFTYDLESYRDELRGFNLDFVAEAPGPLLSTTQQVVDALNNLEGVMAEYADRYRDFREGYCGYDNGDAGERVFKEAIEPNMKKSGANAKSSIRRWFSKKKS